MKDEPIRTGSTPVLHSEPRDVSGTDAHAKLRTALGVPVGGRAARPAREPRSDDPNTNLTATIMKRKAERKNVLREKALAAWTEYEAGATIAELTARYKMSGRTLVSQWKQAGKSYTPRSGPQDRTADARAAWDDRIAGYTMRYVVTKYDISRKKLYSTWAQLGLANPGNVKRIIR